jgi:hypothetical protein
LENEFGVEIYVPQDYKSSGAGYYWMDNTSKPKEFKTGTDLDDTLLDWSKDLKGQSNDTFLRKFINTSMDSSSETKPEEK